MSNAINYSDLFDGLGPGAQELLDFSKSVQGLNRNYRAFAKNLDSDAQRIAAGMAAILTSTQGLQTQTQQVNITNKQSRAGLDEMNAALTRLAQEQERYKAALAGLQTVRRNAKEGTDELTRSLREQQVALKAAFAAKDVEGARLAAQRILELKTETQELSRALRGTSSVFTATQGSYRALEAEARRLDEQLKSLEGGIEGNSEEAQQLKKRLGEINKALIDFGQGVNNGRANVGRYAESLRESISALMQQQRSLEADSQALRTQARATGLSVEQQEKLQQELRNTDTELEKVNGELRSYGVGVQQSQQHTSGFATTTQKAEAGLLGFLGSTVSAYAGLQALSQAVGAAYDDYLAFEAAQSSLAAITGATGKDLEFFADAALRIGPAMGKSGADTLKAFELIGSAQPDLLKSKEGLVAVTEQALLLASASGEALPDAADSLTSVMNQFGATAQQAGRYVNTLAAGAKEGAATIAQTAASLKYAGVNAASANLSIEQTVALVQTLAERSIKGEQAGVNLRNVLAKLASGARETNPEVVGLEKALDTLGKRNLSTAQYTKLFGLENANAAKILVEGREKVRSLTTALTGTQTATEQASKQMDNAAAAGTRLKTVLLSAGSSFLRGFSPLFKDAANGLADFVARLTGLKKTVEEQVQVSSRLIQANQQQAASAQQLLTRYEELTANGVKPTTAEKKELDSITLKLKDTLGESVVAISKETGALQLNKEAVREAIKQRLLLANQEASSLVLKAEAVKNDRIAKEKELTRTLKIQLQTRQQQLEAAGIKYAQREAQGLLGSSKKVFTRISDGKAPVFNPRSKISVAENTAITNYTFTQNDLTASTRRLSEAQAEYNRYMAELKRLGFDAAFIQKTLAGATDATAKATKDNTQAAEENAAVLDRNAKAQAEARKARLQEQVQQQERLIAQAKKAQEEAGRLFEAKNLNGEAYTSQIRGLQDQIVSAERKASGLRIRIIGEEATAKNAEISNELTGIKNKRNVSNAEVLDAEKAASAKRLVVVRETRIAVQKELDSLQERVTVPVLEFKVNGINPDDLAKVERELDLSSERALKRMQDDVDERKRLYDQDAANKQAAEERKRQIEQASINLAFQGLEAYAQIQAGRNATILDNLEQQKQAELAIAGENAELRAQIETQFDARIRAAKRKDAQDKRQAALFEIGLSTAVAVAKSFAESPATFGLPFSAFALAAGALQVATVLAQPLPQYFVGRDGGPAEWAWVGEKGPELVTMPSGQAQLFSQPTVTYLPAGADVHTADKTRQLLASVPRLREPAAVAQQYSQQYARMLIGGAQQIAQAQPLQQDTAGELRDALALQTEQLIRALHERPEQRLTDRGWELFTKRGENTTRYINKLYRRNG
ncbi:phage tail tape measure protein [Hymenobacter metallilatus]|nr:phage tail tape measure protein [Hymenobacter metallilatus]